MPAKKMTMRKIREVLRLRLAAGLSIRQIRESTKISVGAIQKLLRKADELSLVWPLPDDLDDSKLARLFYPAADTTASARDAQSDRAALHQECKGMTKQLLWEEYTQHYPNRCYSNSQFCNRYRHWCGQQKRSMWHTHLAGESASSTTAVRPCPSSVPAPMSCTKPDTTTEASHMPKRNQKQQQWTPNQLKQIKSILTSQRDRLPETLTV